MTCLKTILATGELGDLRQVARASRVCLGAGADFIKTSTGKEAVNATLPVALVMLRAIREHLQSLAAQRRSTVVGRGDLKGGVHRAHTRAHGDTRSRERAHHRPYYEPPQPQQ